MCFPIRNITAFLGTLTQEHSSVLQHYDWEDNLNNKITNKVHKKCKAMALNRPQKGRLFTVYKLKQEGKPLPCVTSAGNMYSRWLKVFVILHMSVNDRESTLSIDFSYT